MGVELKSQLVHCIENAPWKLVDGACKGVKLSINEIADRIIDSISKCGRASSGKPRVSNGILVLSDDLFRVSDGHLTAREVSIIHKVLRLLYFTSCDAYESKLVIRSAFRLAVLEVYGDK